MFEVLYNQNEDARLINLNLGNYNKLRLDFLGRRGRGYYRAV